MTEFHCCTAKRLIRKYRLQPSQLWLRWSGALQLERISFECVLAGFPARSERSRESGGVEEEAGWPSTSLCYAQAERHVILVPYKCKPL